MPSKAGGAATANCKCEGAKGPEFFNTEGAEATERIPLGFFLSLLSFLFLPNTSHGRFRSVSSHRPLCSLRPLC